MRKRFIELLVLLSVALGAGPVGAAMWQWSKTAGLNSSADPSINWEEGMAPSSVNDSARAMMAAMAAYRDDISGLLSTAGSATAYTVTTNQGLSTTPNDGQLLSITVHATNGVNATLTADGGTTYPIQSSSGVAVPSASLIAGSPYSLKFSTANVAWMLKGFYSSSTNIPLGGLLPFTLTTAPNSNFIFPNGQCISTSTYAAYWSALGSPASGICPGGQFQIINLAGRVPAGLDAMPGFFSANRLTNSPTGCGTTMLTVGVACANGLESQTLTLTQIPAGISSSNGAQSISVTSVDTLLGGFSPNASVQSGAGANGFSPGSLPTNGVRVSSGSNSITVTSSNTSGGAHPNVQPTVGVTYLLRVL